MHNTQDGCGFRLSTTVVFWSLILAAPMVSRATTVFSNFGASFAYDTSEGNLVGNDDVGDNLAEADTFTPGFTSTLQTIEIALSCEFVSACPDATTVAIETNSADAPSGTVLESFTIAGNTLPLFGGSGHLTLTSVLNPTLTSGVQYWIVVETDLNNQVEWNLNSTGDVSDQAESADGGASWFSPSGQTPSAYEIDGQIASGVPEPGTLGMMLGGGVLLAFIRKFRG